MRKLAILISLAMGGTATAQVQLQYPPTPGDYVRVLGGKVWIGSAHVSSTLGLYGQSIQHSQLLVSPSTVSLQSSGNDVPLDAKLDAGGNIWIVGNTDSDDFPLVNPIYSQKAPYATAAFVMELNPSASKILFATLLAGPLAQISSPYASHATALAIDSSGNALIGGDTDEPDFPLTVPTTAKLGTGFQATYFYSFLVKISPAGKLIYSTLITTGPATCFSGGTSCASTSANISSIVLDSSGVPTVAGPESGYQTGVGYVARVAADGSKLLWLKTINSYTFIDQLLMVQDSLGRFRLFGRYTPAILQLGFGNRPGGPPGLFGATLSADGSQITAFGDLGQSQGANAAGVIMDPTGKIALLAGTSSNPSIILEGVPNLGADFALNGNIRFPAGVVTAPPTYDSAGNLQILGAQGALLTIPANYKFDSPAIVGFANSASYQMNTGLLSGSLVSLFGFDLPANVQLIVNGVPATTVYSGPTQINFLVPPPFAAGSTLKIVLPSSTITLQPPAVQSVGIFTINGNYAAALNQDGSANSFNNPAAAGSVVSLFGTGFDTGLTTDGVVATSVVPLDVLYFGPAPGLPGVFQINLRCPAFGSPILIQTPNGAGGQLTANPVLLFTH